ncbi:MAG: tetratricopeptide repeat protein [Alcanivoracaceae bacterium]
MSTSSIKLAGLALALAMLAGCASKAPRSVELDVGDGTGGPSRYAEQRAGEAAGDSDAEHIPPVPHDPAVVGIAQEAIPEYARALQTMRAGDLDRALIMFRSLSSRYPQLSGPVVNQGIILSRQGKHAEAEQALRQALDANDRNPYAHNALGVALREQGKFDDARSHYETAVVLDPKYARAHFNLGVLAELYMQDMALALKHFRAYQSLQRQQNPTVANWIADLERRVPDAGPPPGAIAAPSESGAREEELN